MSIGNRVKIWCQIWCQALFLYTPHLKIRLSGTRSYFWTCRYSNGGNPLIKIGAKIAALNFMSRAKAILQSEFPYSIGARCINREWFNLPMPTVWEIFCRELTRTVEDHNLLIHSFVLMSNHFHLIASTPDANISQCMQQFMTQTSRSLTRNGNRINETFAGRHCKCILQHPNYYLNAYKYNYRNPVSAGICSWVEDYPFSTLHGKLKRSKLLIPICEDTTLLSDPIGTLSWLNTQPSPEKMEGVRFGLKRQYFRSKKHKTNNRPLISESDTL